MAIKVNSLNKSNVGYALDVDVSYTCPYCNKSVFDTVSMSKERLGGSVTMCDCECPNCGAYIDLDIDL